MKFNIPEIKEEEFFDKHFEYGDDNDTAVSNFRISLGIFGNAFKETMEFGELADNGEVFDSENAAKAFDNLSLSYRFCLEFAKQMEQDVELRIVPKAKSGSIQEYVNAYLKELFE